MIILGPKTAILGPQFWWSGGGGGPLGPPGSASVVTYDKKMIVHIVTIFMYRFDH